MSYLVSTLLFNRKSNKNNKLDNNDLKKYGIVNQPEVKFYKISDIIRAERIMNEVNTGNLVFLNISRINTYPDKRKKFLTALKLCAMESETTIKMISEDTLMVAPKTIPIQIRNLSPLKNEIEE